MFTVTAIQKPIFNIEIPIAGEVQCGICSKLSFQRLKLGNGNISDFVLSETPLMLKSLEKVLMSKYIEAVEDYIEKIMDALVMPYNVPDNSNDCKLSIFTFQERIAGEYSGLSFAELNELDYIDYCLICADAYKYMIMQNKKDPEKYLNSCWCYMHNEFFIKEPAVGITEV